MQVPCPHFDIYAGFNIELDKLDELDELDEQDELEELGLEIISDTRIMTDARRKTHRESTYWQDIGGIMLHGTRSCTSWWLTSYISLIE